MPAPMTQEEFEKTLDALIEKGLVMVGFNERGELGYVPTALGREVAIELFKQEGSYGNGGIDERSSRTQ